ncbi:MAG: ORF6N domain-containing protein [Bacteroidales bacterium]|jgi:phage regulator Rha-like protein|nr:ORF6N domain-containing protein [Bacteroidales bacterium]MDY0276409.1 ORF6N domain-containing protein [Desulfomicrobium sp.]NCU35910.1 ORF6N domain-containing protein [Candidatus Falkowbacteria bacterium]MDD2631254.1 ORF6N domain-containing protein [Bacteroidales bacterium]MDD3526431.1 ORF6N domain-containing protein [Bacteroidales bacterium]
MELQQIQQKIYDIRDQKVMLDFDLADLYETETKRLKEAVRRNIGRFPPDFMFELTKAEFDVLRTQFATSKRGGTRYMPFAFTEQGVAMLASVLNSPKAIDVNIQIVRAFVFLRKYALSHKELSEKLKQLENKYDLQFKGVYEAIEYLFKKDRQDSEQKNRKRIGY